ncbi:MAG: hypothetical protein K0S33_2466 [Bacteroidetes bacterium]|jgi:hypothetical protein|nr:hypothetical protein [Bacteroidota bacterium]
MKTILYTFSLLVMCVLFSCNTYNYYPHTVSNGFYANQGEFQVSGYMGSAGCATTAGVAVTDRISVMGMYAGNPGFGPYHAKEAEFSAGFNNGRANHRTMFGICGGYGFGSNFKQDSGAVYKRYNGDFNRPFIVLSLGKVSTKSHGVRADAALSVRFNYLTYNGITTDKQGVVNNMDGNHFYYEPYVKGSIGGRHVRFDYGTGFAFKNLTEIGEGVGIWPWHLNIGMTILFGRKYEE